MIDKKVTDGLIDRQDCSHSPIPLSGTEEEGMMDRMTEEGEVCKVEVPYLNTDLITEEKSMTASTLSVLTLMTWGSTR